MKAIFPLKLVAADLERKFDQKTGRYKYGCPICDYEGKFSNLETHYKVCFARGYCPNCTEKIIYSNRRVHIKECRKNFKIICKCGHKDTNRRRF